MSNSKNDLMGLHKEVLEKYREVVIHHSTLQEQIKMINDYVDSHNLCEESIRLCNHDLKEYKEELKKYDGLKTDCERIIATINLAQVL